LEVIVILITSLCFAASPQGKGGNPVTATVTQPADQNAKSPPPMEKLIQALSGEWSAEEIYDPSDLLPAGGKGHSRDSYRAGPARMSLVEEYHGDGVAGKSRGTGIIWWEAEVHGFRFVWCDSYALDRGCRVSSQVGKWDGDDFVRPMFVRCLASKWWRGKSGPALRQTLLFRPFTSARILTS
jgi:hypothetical protein